MQANHRKRLFKLLSILSLIFLHHEVYAIETHTKIWLSTTLSGSLTENKLIKYSLEPEIRFIDDKYKFNQTLFWMAIGYQVTPNILIYIGDTPDTNRAPSGIYSHRNIVWQQVSWGIFNDDSYQIDSRCRFEETKDNHQAAWPIVLRERLLLKMPIKRWHRHALILSEEVFFNLKPASWQNENTFISQNRVLIGIGTMISKHVSSTVGYLNQYQFSNPNQMSNIMIAQLEINAD